MPPAQEQREPYIVRVAEQIGGTDAKQGRKLLLRLDAGRRAAEPPGYQAAVSVYPGGNVDFPKFGNSSPFGNVVRSGWLPRRIANFPIWLPSCAASHRQACICAPLHHLFVPRWQPNRRLVKGVSQQSAAKVLALWCKMCHKSHMTSPLTTYRGEKNLSLRALGDELGVNKTTVRYWERKGIPPERVAQVEKATGIPREQLRPDIFMEATQ